MDFMELARVCAFKIRRRGKAILGAPINYTTFNERTISQAL
jgi:hypothetical protein